MKNILSPLKINDILSLIVLIISAFGWILIDQVFLTAPTQRMIAFILVMLLLLYFQFAINKPANPIRYSNTIALVILSFAVIASVTMHIIINNDFSYKSIMIWLISALAPYISGFIYILTNHRDTLNKA